MKCFYCDGEIESGSEVESETFHRGDGSETTWTWHADCEPGDWVDKDPHRPLCSEPWPTYEKDMGLTALSPYPVLQVSWYARASTWFCWNVTDRLRYWGLWPSRYMAGYRERFPVRTIWGDLWHWAWTKGTCRMVGHRPEEWFHDSYRQRYKCGRCLKFNP